MGNTQGSTIPLGTSLSTCDLENMNPKPGKNIGKIGKRKKGIGKCSGNKY